VTDRRGEVTDIQEATPQMLMAAILQKRKPTGPCRQDDEIRNVAYRSLTEGRARSASGGKISVNDLIYGAPEERRRLCYQASVFPKEFGSPAGPLIPLEDTSRKPSGHFAWEQRMLLLQ
jgi:hypothetical protein